MLYKCTLKFIIYFNACGKSEKYYKPYITAGTMIVYMKFDKLYRPDIETVCIITDI